MCWFNQTIFGLLSSFILTHHVSLPVFPELLCIVFPTFLFLCHICHKHPCSSWSSSSMFSVLSIYRIFCLHKMCDVSMRARTPTHTHTHTRARAPVMCMLILVYTECYAKCVPHTIWQSDSYIGPVFKGHEAFLFGFLDP